MLELIFFVVVTGVLPVVINKSTEEARFDWIKPHLRGIWTAIFVFFLVYSFLQPKALEVAMKLHGQISSFWGYILAILIGGSLLCAYWWFIGKVLMPRPHEQDSFPVTVPAAPLSQPEHASSVIPTTNILHPRHHPVPAIPPITVTGVTVTQTLEAGKKIVLNLMLNNNTGHGFEMKTLTVTGIQNFYGDPDKDKEMEDSLWRIIEERNGTQVPLILPSRVTNMAFTAETVPLTAELVADLKSQSKVAYFLIQLRDKNGVIVLDFCGHTNSNNRFDYCRSHNGP